VIAVRRHIINGCFQTLFLNMVHLLAHLQQCMLVSIQLC
jgi:hypothetical protein